MHLPVDADVGLADGAVTPGATCVKPAVFSAAVFVAAARVVAGSGAGIAIVVTILLGMTPARRRRHRCGCRAGSLAMRAL